MVLRNLPHNSSQFILNASPPFPRACRTPSLNKRFRETACARWGIGTPSFWASPVGKQNVCSACIAALSRLDGTFQIFFPRVFAEVFCELYPLNPLTCSLTKIPVRRFSPRIPLSPINFNEHHGLAKVIIVNAAIRVNRVLIVAFIRCAAVHAFRPVITERS